ncbi:uncharacterized protein with ParB-like and HNH nuclease domain [Dysgonomonadaceae bacterium PH5-43]|nr:uncharacterized protein with ParB-like and HNH nuclease domain [Dysgonomonadaceae bacterium PH5-43]
MSNNKIELKSISELLGINFFIPSYQRGYRWTGQQVKDLLEDINDFVPKEIDKSNEKTWYCLQPVIVKKKEEAWEVIDGQQRLTTIYLILHYLNQGYVENRRRKLFDLEYETRNTDKLNSKDFLMNIGNKNEFEALSNIDYWHIFQAYQTIEEWFRVRNNSVDSDFESKLLKNSQVIWYETNDKDAVTIFTRINMGKIPLTNAELIKALFLNRANFEMKNFVDEERLRLKQLEIATEWDFMELTLQNDEFWMFLNRDENKKDTRIEILFELIIGLPEIRHNDKVFIKTFEEYYNETRDNYYTYRKFDKKFKNKSEEEIKNNWKEIKQYFQIIQDWFNDRELYHKIGFLITIGENINTLIDASKKKNKLDFREWIDNVILYTNVEKKEYRYNYQLSDIKYGNGMIRQILLLHNIQTMLNNEKANSRFPFNRYKKEKWDIEHIHAKASEAKIKDDFKEQQIWLSENFEKNETVHNNEEMNNRVQKLLEGLLEEKGDKFQEIIDYVLGEPDDDLKNLCLLDKGTNRSYKNDSFKNKRKKIIEQEKKGTFIPICTRNIFLKYYSEELKQLGQWSETDRIAYLENIKDVLRKYLPTQK